MPHQHRVLIIDDDADSRDGLAALLSLDVGVTVRTAASAQDGLALLRRDGVVCVVVLDYRMPEMNGATLMEHMRTAAPGVAVLLLTGDTEAAAHAREWGARDVVLKPIVPPTFVALIERHCALSQTPIGG